MTDLVDLMEILRENCPWDKKQTHDSIKSSTLEEAYEFVEALDEKDFPHMKEELGDLLLQIVFHAKMAEEEEQFNIDDVINNLIEKLKRRHPHIFSDTKVDGVADVLKNWEAIKLKEGRSSVLGGVPKALPAIERAFKLQQKASKVGFDWKNKEDVWNKVKEEIAEVKESEISGSKEETESEMGDLLFSMINYARFIGINPENALRKSNKKFEKRFNYIEKRLKEQGSSITDSCLEEMDHYWDEAKQKE